MSISTIGPTGVSSFNHPHPHLASFYQLDTNSGCLTTKDYSKPLHVDCSVEYELPSSAKPPAGSKYEPLLMIHPAYYRQAESQNRSVFVNNMSAVSISSSQNQSRRTRDLGLMLPPPSTTSSSSTSSRKSSKVVVSATSSNFSFTPISTANSSSNRQIENLICPSLSLPVPLGGNATIIDGDAFKAAAAVAAYWQDSAVSPLRRTPIENNNPTVFGELRIQQLNQDLYGVGQTNISSNHRYLTTTYNENATIIKGDSSSCGNDVDNSHSSTNLDCSRQSSNGTAANGHSRSNENRSTSDKTRLGSVDYVLTSNAVLMSSPSDRKSVIADKKMICGNISCSSPQKQPAVAVAAIAPCTGYSPCLLANSPSCIQSQSGCLNVMPPSSQQSWTISASHFPTGNSPQSTVINSNTNPRYGNSAKSSAEFTSADLSSNSISNLATSKRPAPWVTSCSSNTKLTNIYNHSNSKRSKQQQLQQKRNYNATIPKVTYNHLYNQSPGQMLYGSLANSPFSQWCSAVAAEGNYSAGSSCCGSTSLPSPFGPLLDCCKVCQQQQQQWNYASHCRAVSGNLPSTVIWNNENMLRLFQV